MKDLLEKIMSLVEKNDLVEAFNLSKSLTDAINQKISIALSEGNIATMKVVYNSCYGGFGLSDKAVKMLSKIKGEEVDKHDYIHRHDEDLVKVVEELGDEASGDYAFLCIEEVPKDIYYWIDEYDGSETVMY